MKNSGGKDTSSTSTRSGPRMARNTRLVVLLGVVLLWSTCSTVFFTMHAVPLLSQQQAPKSMHLGVPSRQDWKEYGPEQHVLSREAIPDYKHKGNQAGKDIIKIPNKTPSFNYNERDRQCYRRCPPCAFEGGKARNAIVFTRPWKAGINDREKIFDALANLAAYLCAELRVLAPHEMLIPQHNFGRPLSNTLHWYDFFNITQNRYSVSPSNGAAENTQQPFQKLPFSIENKPNPPNTNSSTRHIIATNNRTTLVKDFLLAKTYSMRMKCDAKEDPDRHAMGGTGSAATRNGTVHGFEWRIDISWWGPRQDLRKHLQKNMKAVIHRPYIRLPKSSIQDTLPKECRYAEIKPSRRIKDLANIVWDDITRTYSTKDVTFGTLMIRRGDKVTMCNTNLTKMKYFLQCSFEPVKDRDVLLLYTTDERDPAYTDAIQHMVENDARGNGKRRLLVLDGLIEERLQKPDVPVGYRNNYHLFSIAKELMARSKFALHQHLHTGCPECSPIVM